MLIFHWSEAGVRTWNLSLASEVGVAGNPVGLSP